MAAQTATLRPALPEGMSPGLRERLFYLGLTIIRVGFGLVFLTNGIAKLPGQFDGVHPFPGFLITRDGARGSLEFNTMTHPVGLYKRFVDDVLLPNWGVVGGLLTATEIVIGVCLIVGLLTPIAALLGAGFALHLNFMVWDRNVWMWEYAVEWMPLLGLALMRAGRYWGLDALLARRFPRWPVT